MSLVRLDSGSLMRIGSVSLMRLGSGSLLRLGSGALVRRNLRLVKLLLALSNLLLAAPRRYVCCGSSKVHVIVSAYIWS